MPIDSAANQASGQSRRNRLYGSTSRLAFADTPRGHTSCHPSFRRDVGSASVSIQPGTAPPGAVPYRSSELSHYRVLAASRDAVRLPDAPSMGVVLSASSNYGNVPLARIHGTRCSTTPMRTACNRRGAIGEPSRVADTGRSQCWSAPGVVFWRPSSPQRKGVRRTVTITPDGPRLHGSRCCRSRLGGRLPSPPNSHVESEHSVRVDTRIGRP